ncbi:GMP synthase (glutamine-hydrolyzing) [Brevinema andersonii]|uniref:GMP synthase (glutamine-hydrolyzing) n=1 Tax=Brevinema andersonii TaxID=34097 RepID=A0A1I1EL23_BREAD|nr:glutamine-hydrolyzing GMP synthase [Brevinema andersonii]SFB87815.1 GMP synthase (glutamine-hydrolyzing) [Brevinema andersonii]
MVQILILDFGSQSTHLIARRFKDLGYLAQIVPSKISVEEIKVFSPKALIFSGSPDSVYEDYAQSFDHNILNLDIPKLGICYGFQCVVHYLKGKIQPSKIREYGNCPIQVIKDNSLLYNMDTEFVVWMSHGDSITALPEGFQLLAESNHHPAVACYPEKNFWGVQFHPELEHTKNGIKILENFAQKIAEISPSKSNIAQKFKQISQRIQNEAKDKTVLLLISGGVDSSVTAATLLKNLNPQNIHLMYIDTGLMRKNETQEIERILSQLEAKYIHIIDAKDDFLSALKGVTDPEEKRRTIGNMFITVMEKEVKKLDLPSDYLLAQGTLYTDLIESGKGIGNTAHIIKSHHNVNVPFINEKRKAGLLLEPLNECYKDEVRALGLYLGLPISLINRHPFPGPGLSIRIIGEVSHEAICILQEADSIYLEELHKRNLYEQIWQAFAVLLPVKSIGVAGDIRKYGWTIALRAVSATDGISADIFEFPWKDLKEISSRITNELQSVVRVVYDISSKPPATIEWE